MLSGFVTTGRSSAANGPRRRLWPSKRRAVPSAPGVTCDTSPRNGCRMATEVAIAERAANTAASDLSLTMVSAQELAVPVWELVDFVRHRADDAFTLSSRN